MPSLSFSRDFPGILIASDRAARTQTLPSDLLMQHFIELRIGNTLDMDQLVHQLIASGYQRKPVVQEMGDFALRGGIVDIFPPGNRLKPDEYSPLRIECFDDEIESIRRFQAQNQRSTEKLTAAEIIPCNEIVLSKAIREEGGSRIKEFADRHDIGKSVRTHYQDMLTEAPDFQVLQDILPEIYGETTTVLDYLDTGNHLAFVEPDVIEEKRKDQDQEVHGLLQRCQTDKLGLISDQALIPADSWQDQLQRNPGLILESTTSYDQQVAFHVDPLPVEQNPFLPQIQEYAEQDYVVHLFCYSVQQRQRMQHLIDSLEIEDVLKERIHLHLGQLTEGFKLPDHQAVFIPERTVFGVQTKRRPSRALSSAQTADPKNLLSDFHDGCYIVHIDHGIGIFRGLHHMNIMGQEADFALLEYQGGDRLYLPTYRLNLIQLYSASGDDDAPIVIDRLGGQAWSKKKHQVRKAIEAMAKELLELYAKRKVAEGFAFGSRDQDMDAFEAGFPYTETRDQLKAIDDVLNDMHNKRPMDRLICGDVGFGKTEVAMRAAYRAISDQKQVAVLVPTTLLAAQHYRTFKERFSNTGANIVSMSRFVTGADQKQIVEDLANGKADIVVGTHRLLSKDIQFKDLGLLIVDEEHRFGVSHKERIKQFRANVDVVSMSATPIPRTLQMSLYGFRDFSVIATPPPDRQTVKTFVAKFDDHLIRSAIMNELKRDGQVFFVHNRIQTIDAMGKYVQDIVPEAKIGIVHGGMSEKEVEQVMLRFVNKEINVLLATVIIESGLDFPDANTLMINRADHLGLAQLYQLRGRVGRSNRQAFAYFLIPGEDLISEKARKRMRAIQSFTDLGSGYRIALRDLEIRGAGNLLGTKQSGHIRSLGIELYTKLLDQCVASLQGESVESEVETEMKLSVPAFLPGEYVQDEGLRLELYRQLSSTRDRTKLPDLRSELEDRFGPLPQEAQNLFGLIEVKILANQLRLKQFRLGADGMALTFDESTRLNPEQIVALLQNQEVPVKMLDPNTLFVGQQPTTTENQKAFSLSDAINFLKRLG